MDERRDRLEQIVSQAVDLDPDQRSEFLDRACGGDTELRREVEKELAARLGAPPTLQKETPDHFGAVMRMLGSAASPEYIGKYRLIREIGRGGFGVIYLAATEADGVSIHVAIKVVIRGMDTEEVIRRFEVERQLLASLNHPNIARLYDAGTTEDGRPYFVMEYIEGVRLDEWCDRNKLSISERLRLFGTVCDAVQYAHQNLVVHRDLKPSNVIVTNEGVPKLLDFGIAKVLSPVAASLLSDPTAGTTRVMTPEYASPEQMRGLPVSTASDVYSLGAMLYEVLTGHKPYMLESRLGEVAERIICEEEPVRPSAAVSLTEKVKFVETSRAGEEKAGTRTISPDTVAKTRGGRPDRLRRRLSGDIDNIVMMALRKEPRNRYAAALQLKEDIDRHLEGLPVVARGDSYAYRFWKGVKRNRTAVTVAAVIAISLVGGTTLALRSAATAQMARRDLKRAVKEVLKIENSISTSNPLQFRLQYLNGMTPIVDDLALSQRDDRDLQLDLAMFHDRNGEVLGGLGTSNLGLFQEAIASFQRALDIREGLLAASEDPEAAKAMALSHFRIGNIYKSLGEPQEALRHFEETLRLAEQYDSARKKRLSLGAIGQMLLRINGVNSRSALKRIEESEVLKRRRYDKIRLDRLDDPKALGPRDLAVGVTDLAQARMWAGETREAIELYRESLALAKDAEQQLGGALRTDRLVMHRQADLAEALRIDGNLEQAKSLIQSAVEAAESAYEIDESNVEACRDLAKVLCFEGTVHGAIGQVESGRESLKESHRLMSRRLEDEPRDNGASVLLAEATARLGYLEVNANDDAIAVGYLEEARELYESIVENDKRQIGPLQQVTNALEQAQRRLQTRR